MFEKLLYDLEAYKLLKKCSDAKDMTEWNEYRKTNNNAPINLRFSDFQSLYLVGANMQNIDFRCSFLNRTDMRNADVSKANFSSKIYLYIYLLYLFTYVFSLFVGNAVIISYGTLIKYIDYENPMLILLYVLSILPAISIGTIIENIFAMRLNRQLFIAIILGASYFIFEVFIFFIMLDNTSLILIFKNVLVFTANLLPIIIIVVAVLSILIYYLNIIIAQKTIVQAKNPEECIGFDVKYLKYRDTSIYTSIEKEIKEQEKQLNAIVDNEAAKTKLSKSIEENKKLLIEGKTQDDKLEDIIRAFKKPYFYLERNINQLKVLNTIYFIVILCILGVFLYFRSDFISNRANSFNKLFAIKDTLPEFGTIFGVILFYGTPILLSISIIIYLIAQINKNLDKISNYQIQNRGIYEVESIIKARAILGLKANEFKTISNKLIDQLEESIMKDASMPEIHNIDTKSEPQFSYIKLIEDIQKIIKEELKGK